MLDVRYLGALIILLSLAFVEFNNQERDTHPAPFLKTLHLTCKVDRISHPIELWSTQAPKLDPTTGDARTFFIKDAYSEKPVLIKNIGNPQAVQHLISVRDPNSTDSLEYLLQVSSNFWQNYEYNLNTGILTMTEQILDQLSDSMDHFFVAKGYCTPTELPNPLNSYPI